MVLLEVKPAVSRQAKSLRFYRDTYSPPVSLRTSLRPYQQEDWLINLPLYAVDRLGDVLGMVNAAPPFITTS